MRFRVLWRFFLLAHVFASTSVWADQLIIEPDRGREPILHAIQSAHHSISLVMYGFTDDAFLKALLQQKERGRHIQVILEPHPYKNEAENDKMISALTTHHIAWQGTIPPFRFIHQKTLVIDNRHALIMTFNFTHASFKRERNFALIIDNPTHVHAITTTFSADWHHQPSQPSSAELIWSPENSREKLLTAIRQAKREIAIYAQSINDRDIVDALAKVAHQGIKVNILTSVKIRKKQARRLTRAGVIVKRSQHYYIHAKVMIIDQERAILGSINLTRTSLDKNRELAVMTTDPIVVKQLIGVFSHDWHQGKSITRCMQTVKSSHDSLHNFLFSDRIFKLMRRSLAHHSHHVKSN